MREELAFLSHGKQEKIVFMEQNRPKLGVWYACVEQPWTYSCCPCTYCSVTQWDFSRDEAKSLSPQTTIPVQERFRNPPCQDITERNHPAVGEKTDQQQDCPLYPSVLLLCLLLGNRILGLGVPLVPRAFPPEDDPETTCIETSQACDSHESSLWSFPGVISKAPCGSGDICWLWRWWETSRIIVLSLL